MAQKDYALEHTKPTFNNHNLFNLHNLYVIRSLVDLLKILKFHSPIPIFEYFFTTLVFLSLSPFPFPEPCPIILTSLNR